MPALKIGFTGFAVFFNSNLEVFLHRLDVLMRKYRRKHLFDFETGFTAFIVPFFSTLEVFLR